MLKFFLFSLTCLMNVFAAAGIEGLWIAMDDKTNKPGCIVNIYEYKNKYYGRIVGIYDEGKLNELYGTLEDPKKKAPGLRGQPYYSGLDLIWNMVPRGSKYLGNIVDPRSGSVYNAEIWRQGKDLIVRGKLWIFGRNQTWRPLNKDRFPKNFKLPDTGKFIPVIPRAK